MQRRFVSPMTVRVMGQRHKEKLSAILCLLSKADVYSKEFVTETVIRFRDTRKYRRRFDSVLTPCVEFATVRPLNSNSARNS